jgi:hypothetical protein
MMAEPSNLVLKMVMDFNGSTFDFGEIDLGKVAIEYQGGNSHEAHLKVNTDALYGNIVEGLRSAADQIEAQFNTEEA